VRVAGPSRGGDEVADGRLLISHSGSGGLTCQ
jgi:hypothetical protein